MRKSPRKPWKPLKPVPTVIWQKNSRPVLPWVINILVKGSASEGSRNPGVYFLAYGSLFLLSAFDCVRVNHFWCEIKLVTQSPIIARCNPMILFYWNSILLEFYWPAILRLYWNYRQYSELHNDLKRLALLPVMLLGIKIYGLVLSRKLQPNFGQFLSTHLKQL